MEQSHTGRIPDLFCTVHTANKELLNLVCLDAGCSSFGLLCRLCCSEDHKDHHTIATIQLVEDIGNCQYDQSLATKVSNSVLKVKNARVRCLNSISDARQLITSELAKLEQQVNAHFDSEHHSLENTGK